MRERAVALKDMSEVERLSTWILDAFGHLSELARRRTQVNHGSESGNDAQPTRPGVALNPGNVLHAVKLGTLNQITVI
jgi:hypothetical protein